MPARPKQWRKPKLIALVRGKPEETVLTTCKGFPHPYRYSRNIQGSCRQGYAFYGCHSYNCDAVTST